MLPTLSSLRIRLLLITGLSTAITLSAVGYGFHAALGVVDDYRSLLRSEANQGSALLVDMTAAFKTQVQEWQNVLLRGHEPARLQQHWTPFETNEQRVQDDAVHLLSLLEDTGYLARAAFLMDRVLRPFGLPGHAFMPLLSSHACALPGIMSARGIPDRLQRLATILVAPFMTCSARIPVYVVLTTMLFYGRPGMAALAFSGCYALGLAAGLMSALIARRTILRGKPRAMVLELPSFKVPSLRTALLSAYDRSMVFVKKAGTVILAISIVLWWLGSFPQVEATQQVVDLRARAEAAATPEDTAALVDRADRLEASQAVSRSYAGRMGRAVQPVFAPLGYDWRLSIGVMTSFAAREVFVATMAVVTLGEEGEEMSSETLAERFSQVTRDDGVTPVFTAPASWSLLVYYVLAMQCLPTLAVTAREAGGWRWAGVQFAWMTGVAYGAAFVACSRNCRCARTCRWPRTPASSMPPFADSAGGGAPET